LKRVEGRERAFWCGGGGGGALARFWIRMVHKLVEVVKEKRVHYLSDSDNYLEMVLTLLTSVLYRQSLDPSAWLC